MELPVVTIVGRPNVGKSTLFNRIVGGRESIVHDLPGVTRDCKYHKVEWTGHNFILTDTGGYMPDSTDKIEKAIFEQLVSAISASDLVIFLVDAKTGLTALDEEIALQLKRSGCKIFLVV